MRGPDNRRFFSESPESTRVESEARGRSLILSTFAGSGRSMSLLSQVGDKSSQRQQIAVSTEPRDAPQGGPCDPRTPTKRFSSVGIGKVDFDAGKGNGAHRIVKGDGRVREGTRIDQETIGLGRSTADPIEDLTLMVGLTNLKKGPESRGFGLKTCMDVREGFVSVNGRLPGAQELEIGSRDTQNPKSFPRLRRRDVAPHAFAGSLRGGPFRRTQDNSAKSLGEAIRSKYLPLPRLPSGLSARAT